MTARATVPGKFWVSCKLATQICASSCNRKIWGSGQHRVLYFWHSVGNRLLTLLSNCLTNINLSDMETCYKAFRREIIQAIPIEENRFGFEPEITVKIAKRRLRIYEVGISYWG